MQQMEDPTTQVDGTKWSLLVYSLYFFYNNFLSLCCVFTLQPSFQLWGKNRRKKLLPFSIPEDKKLTSKLFFVCLHWDICVVLLHLWRVKSMSSIKILVLCPPDLELCVLRKAKNPNTSTSIWLTGLRVKFSKCIQKWHCIPLITKLKTQA